jgi:hypothetical protein
MEIDRGLDDDVILRPDGTTRGKCSIFGWKGRGVVCGYSRLQGGSPHLCWLRTIHSGTLSKYLNCTECMLILWFPVNRHSLMILVVGRYPTIPLEMFTGIVYMPPTNSPMCGIVWKMCTRERWDLDRPCDVFLKGCHMWPVRGRVCLLGLPPCKVVYWFRSLQHSDMSDSLFTAPTRRHACIIWWRIKIDN